MVKPAVISKMKLRPIRKKKKQVQNPMNLKSKAKVLILQVIIQVNCMVIETKTLEVYHLQQ